MVKQSENDGFLSRWSRRKLAIAAGETVPDESLEHAPLSPSTAPQQEISEERAAELEANKAAAEAIDLDTLEYDSDFSAFLKDGVPALLRQKALRILWRSNPILANVDGLCDYDDNFADPSLILTKFESAYRIGKGYLFDEEEKTDESAPEPAEVATSDASSSPTDEPRETQAPEEEVQNLASADEATTDQGLADKRRDGNDAPDLVAVESAAFEENTLEEAALPRPRVSLRKRLQFDV